MMTKYVLSDKHGPRSDPIARAEDSKEKASVFEGYTKMFEKAVIITMSRTFQVSISYTNVFPEQTRSMTKEQSDDF